MPTELELLAESPNTRMPLGPGEELVQTDRFALWLGRSTQPGWTVVQQVRAEPATVADVLAEVRAVVRDRGRQTATWEIGNLSCRPPDLADRLLELVPDDEPFAVGMALTERPPDPPPGVTARPVETFEEYQVANQIMREAFGMSPEHIVREQERDPERWRDRQESSITFLAFIHGEPAAAANGTMADAGAILFGGATRRELRGKGAYRALVRARWDEAARRGKSALVTQAGHMSRPILRRLGFREVAEIRMLRDDNVLRSP
jgi:hypothetical protein